MTAPIIVTGGAGFIGSALAAHLLASGAGPVAIVDDLGPDPSPAPRWRNLAGLPISDYWDKSEFLVRIESGRGLPPVRAIAHLGACSSTTEPDAAFLMRNNFAYTRTLAQWALARGVRFVYASSAATYGDGGEGYRDDPALLPRLRPLNAYGFSKHAFDLWAWQSGALDAILGLKYFNVYGPNEFHKGEMRSMVLKAFEQIRATGAVRLFQSHRPEFADGEQRRDFLYVADAVAVTAWFLEHPEIAGLYNLGGGVARTWNDLARAVFAALDRPPCIEYFPMPEAMRAAYQYFTCADLARLRRTGAPQPAWTLEAGVADYVRTCLLPGASRLG